MELPRLLSFALLSTWIWLSSPSQGAVLYVNEYSNVSSGLSLSKMSAGEYVEFVVGERATASQLAALTFGDTNDATSMLRSVFRFDEATLVQALGGGGQTEFLPGTIIVVKGALLGAQDLSYSPTQFNTGNTDAWKIELVAGQGARDHSETLINGTLAVGNSGDVLWVSSSNPPTNNTDTSGLIHAIGHSTSPGTIAQAVNTTLGSGLIWTGGNLNNGRSLANVGTADAPQVASTTGSRGAANSAANGAWLTTLRDDSFIVTVPEPSRVLLLAVGGWALILRRERPRAERRAA